MLGEEAGLLADTLIGLNTIDFRFCSLSALSDRLGNILFPAVPA